MKICVICLHNTSGNVELCDRCAKSYENTDGGDMLDVVVWAAERTRYFERRRRKR